MARPNKCTPEVLTKFLEALRLGCYRDDAARYAGIHPSTASRWIKDGEDPMAEECYREFHKRVLAEEARVAMRASGIILKAADHDWKAAAWWLERKRPDQWGRKDRRQEIDLNVSTDAEELTLEQLLEQMGQVRAEQLGES